LALARLVYKDQSGRDRTVDIGPQRTRVTIGRNADCVIQTNNASVSREHTVVMYNGDGAVSVVDPPPGSPTNGTYVNGRRKRPGEVAHLADGDELRCGNFAIMFHDEPVANVGRGGFEPPIYDPPPYEAPSYGSPPPRATFEPPQYGSPGWAEPQPALYPPPVAPTHYPPPPGFSPEELESLRRDNLSLQAVEQRQREQIEQLQNAALDKERVVSDQERRLEHHDNVVEGLNDRIAKLKEQVDLQKDQLRGYRDELKLRNDQIEDLDFKLSTLEDARSNNDQASASAVSTIADLKVQINQRDRKIDDLQRELDLAQYAMTSEKDNVERLEMTLSQVNNQIEGFERYRGDMKKVVEQHEATIDDLRHAVDQKERENLRLVEDLRAMEKNAGSGRGQQEELDRLRATLRERDEELRVLDGQLREAERRGAKNLGGGDGAETERLKAQVRELEESLEAAQASGGGGDGRREMAKQVNDLKRENRDLRMALDAGGGAAASGASAGGGSPEPELKRRIVELEKEVEDARKRAREAQRAPSSGGGADESQLRQRAKDVYNSINDIVSQWRDDMQTLEGFVADIKRLVLTLAKVDLQGLPTVDRVRLEGVIGEVDPKMTIEEIEMLVGNNQSAAGAIKSSLRDLRDVVG